ncbi:hypothetical protein B2J93_4945 [Marssonina coronariae]|uniref:NADH dehydrogenase [ubiquinone] 1 beta subcomplex subunit 9 n=1 Tax=Diplocarpon coronariae TaxID=2795749 RepID=A0A218ZE25_9HELO|nr:hypothetical protein B2J93_4945 [Marssonina coronariae]
MSTKQAVSSLYRRSLKLSLDWAVHRYLWRGQALYIRSLFEANKNIKDPRQQRAGHTALFQEAEAVLEKWKHPDPYHAPTAPGGSKYERNLPAPILDPPMEITK